MVVKGRPTTYEEYEDLCEQLGETPLESSQQWRKHYHLLIEEN